MDDAVVDTSWQRFLAIDAGNTRVKFGVIDWAGAGAFALPQCLADAAIAVGGAIPWRELPGEQSTPAFITGSNPGEIERICRDWPADRTPPVVLTDRETFPIEIDVDFPDKVGIDRLLNGVAANRLRESGQCVVIVDSGTATTVDCVDAEGRFCGGAILPGFDLCARALHQYTALLPVIEMSSVLQSDAAPAELGRNTEAAITGGLYWGHVGAVKELVGRLSGHDEPGQESLLLLTGGAAPLLHPHLSANARMEPHLALQGLAIVAASQSSSDQP
ncbi:MAG: type III pantothenate kinase [Planctomycetota bacterium]|nr:MAG: type III pantothenate kinase [Planctomycetota bacterium]REJ89501.1 MAG: type III pantothenate kinase [Planctomycetota bacterium]REK28928.1 MAG: type III pantothenate kinase [Planctomycetota bacterium]REK39638.1 MAG: type III pantothenate kinase [Planctomycetota bacterium]